MKSIFLYVTILSSISGYCCEKLSCRTNCSINGTYDQQCLEEALHYRSSELIVRIFSVGSLSVYVDTFQRAHQEQLNSSIELIRNSLDETLFNESTVANLSIDLFSQASDLLINLCQQLTAQPIASLKQLPPLFCSESTCSSNVMNYMVLFIISIAICSLTLIICMIQSIRLHRRPNIPLGFQISEPVMSSSNRLISTNID